MKYENVHELDQNAENIDEDAKYEKRAELMDNAIEATRTFRSINPIICSGFYCRGG